MTEDAWFKKLLTDVGKFQLENQQEINPAVSDHKSRIDLVTRVDRESERKLVAALEQKYPDDGILAEEETSREGKSGRRWIIDPLDGTTNYVHHHPFFGISVGLEADEEIIAAYTYFPVLDSFYSARRGEEAYCNGEVITVSSNKEPLNSLLATGFADMRTENQRYNLPVFTSIIEHVQGIRRGGSAVHDLCMVAEGVFDGFWEFNLSPWDVAAGALIVRCAGGKVTDMDGGDDWLHGQNIVASNQLMHDRLISWINKQRD